MKLLLALRSIALYSLLGSLVSLEISHLYFEDHTIFGYLLSSASRKLALPYLARPGNPIDKDASIPWRLRIARRLLVGALWWEKLWLSKRHVLLLPVYVQLLELLKIMRESDALKKYSQAMNRLKSRERRKLLVETAQKTLDMMKTIQRKLQDINQSRYVRRSLGTVQNYMDRLPWR